MSKYSCTCSRSTAGANGRNALAELDLQVHHLLHLRRARVADDRRPPAPAARTPSGPGTSRRPSRRPAIRRPAGDRLVAVERLVRSPRAAEERRDLVVVEARPEQRPALRVRRPRRPRLAEHVVSEQQRTPSAPPASPAAGWIQRSSNGPSRQIRPLPTQFSATPPAMHQLLHAGRLLQVPGERSITSSQTACTTRPGPSPASVSRSSGSRGGPPNRPWNRSSSWSCPGSS